MRWRASTSISNGSFPRGALDSLAQGLQHPAPALSLAMAFPAARFTAATDAIGLRLPAGLTRQPPPSPPAPKRELSGPAAAPAGPDSGGDGRDRAVELDREVPPSGNLWIAGQQIWPGPAMTGRTVRIWAGLSQVHVLLDGHRIKTLPSRLDARDLAGSQAPEPGPPGRPRCLPQPGT